MTALPRQTANEVSACIDVLRGACEDLAIRGTRVASPDDLRALGALASDLRRESAVYLADRVEQVLGAVREGKPSASLELLRAIAALRVYERLLSLGVADAELSRAFLSDREEREGAAAESPKGPPPVVDLDRKGALPVADGVVTATLELVSTGLTAASEATRKKLDLAMKEASRLKLVRLAAALRFASDEMGRYLEKSQAFSRRRYVFFTSRAWLLAGAIARAIREKDEALLSRLSFSAQPRPMKRLEVVTLGVSKRVAAGTQVAFELRMRALSEVPGLVAPPRIVWSAVFAHRDGIPPEAFLHLPQPQKFTPRVFLEKKRVVLENVALAPDESGGARLLLGPSSTVTTSSDAFEDFDRFASWDAHRALARVRAHRPSPLDLEVELAEEVVLEGFTLGAPTLREDRGQWVYPMKVAGTELDAVASAGPDGKELKAALDALMVRAPAPRLFGIMHYELGALVLQPLSILEASGPTYLPISDERIDTATLLKSITF